jgi:hypothetical protein
MSDYYRVIPRDFFNESKLLKCFGLLALKHLDGMAHGLEIEHDGSPFEIQQDDDGNLFINNVKTEINGDHVVFYTRYNRKDTYPFYCVDKDGTEIEVFTEQGEFTEDFSYKLAFYS